MAVCNDVYVMRAPAGCGYINAYPSQVHPFTPPPSGTSGGGMSRGWQGRRRKRKHYEDDALALILIERLRE
jgi:hypothetical protein